MKYLFKTAFSVLMIALLCFAFVPADVSVETQSVDTELLSIDFDVVESNTDTPIVIDYQSNDVPIVTTITSDFEQAVNLQMIDRPVTDNQYFRSEALHYQEPFISADKYRYRSGLVV